MAEFKIENGTSLDEAVGMTVGYGSRCWVGGTGDLEFDSTSAAQAVNELVAAIRDGRVRDGNVKVQVNRWVPIDSHGQVQVQGEAAQSPYGTPPQPPSVDPAAPTVNQHDQREVDGG